MENILLGLATIVTLGVVAQWISWRLRVPAILLLLAFGFGAGPGLQFLDPDLLFGKLLIPLVSISVGLILFEGGLSLKIRDLKQIGSTFGSLITVGALVSWIVTSVAAHFFLKFNVTLSILLSAILVVTGPTVILPMLTHLRLKGKTGPLLRWEGIVIDPIGAMLAVLVFEAILSAGFQIATLTAILAVIKTILVGGILGWLGASLIVGMLRRYWIPDHLQNPISFMMVLAVFALANFAQKESGLLATTVMGIVLANQKSVSIKHIVEFKENLRVLLNSSLFIILAARLRIEDLQILTPESGFFLGTLILFARPLSILAATWKSNLNWREKCFLSFMAPRGIVAAAVSSVFALKLVGAGYADAARLVPATFLVITGTVFIYGILGPIAARLLKLSNSNPQGILIVGAHGWGREIAQLLWQKGVQVLVADSNPNNIRLARKEGIPAYYGNILSEEALRDVDLDGIGKMIALTSNEEVNSMAALQFADMLGRAEIYQLPMKLHTLHVGRDVAPTHLSGRILFGIDHTYDWFEEILGSGAKIESLEITKHFDFASFAKDPKNTPLFCIVAEGRVEIFAVDKQIKPSTGQTLIYARSG